MQVCALCIFSAESVSWDSMVTTSLPSDASHDAGPDGLGGGLRERKKRATRMALRWAAVRLASERGLDNVTTEEIAAEANVSQRTLFNYFGSKEEVIVGDDPELGHQAASALLERPGSEPPLQALKAVFVELSESMTVDGDLWRARMRIIHDNPSLYPRLMGSSAGFVRELSGAVAERTGLDPERDAYPALVVGVVMSAVRTTVQHHLSNGIERPVPELVAEALDQVMAGLPQPR